MSPVPRYQGPDGTVLPYKVDWSRIQEKVDGELREIDEEIRISLLADWATNVEGVRDDG